MRIFCITQEEPFYLPIFWERVFREKSKDIIGICILSPDRALGDTIRRHYILYGPWFFLLQSFLFVCYKCVDLVSGALHIPLKRFYSVARVASERRVNIYKAGNINSPSFLDTLEKLKPDIIISVASSQVFKKRLLALPPRGCINVHSALLPRGRGMLPSFWVLFNEKVETGVTIHYMDESLDSGDIILQEQIGIEPADTQHSIILKTKKIGARLLLKAIENIEGGAVERSPNDFSQASYFSFPTREEAKKFRRMGKKFR